MIKILKELLKVFLNKLGYRLSHVEQTEQFFDLEALLYLQIRNNADLFFIQIGACDGASFDPIYKFVVRNHKKVRGIVIEPLSDYFKELQRNYKKYPNIVPVPLAIHNAQKEMILYRVNPSRMKDLPKWAKGIASFNRNHHKLLGIPSDLIIQEKVPCISFAQLLDDYRVEKIDLMQIDTEGYDGEVILGIDFNYIKPKIIHFEHGLPSGIMGKEQFLKVIDVLHKNGYELAFEKYDAIAYQRNIIVDL
jgi:FkbM family methyltransferase